MVHLIVEENVRLEDIQDALLLDSSEKESLIRDVPFLQRGNETLVGGSIADMS